MVESVYCNVKNPQWLNHSMPTAPKDNFGIVTLNLEKSKCQFNNTHIILTVDRSGSMQDICEDKKSKMEHVHHTINNMILYYHYHLELELESYE